MTKQKTSLDRQTLPYNPISYHPQRKKSAKKRRRALLHRLALNAVILASGLLCIALLFLIFQAISLTDFSEGIFNHAPQNSPIMDPAETSESDPSKVATSGKSQALSKEFRELLKHNPEMQDFVTHYADRETYLNTPVDLSADQNMQNALDAGEVPLLMQWDLRWGYATYGNEMIGLAGCGPTCLSMAYIYLTGDPSMDPAAMADFACKEGFYTEAGTSWSLWTDGVSLLGLEGNTLSLSESAMKSVLDNGGLIICSMRPGDFTTTGHIVLIRGYDENGFYVNDPNRESNSAIQWSYQKISPQIKNLWGIQKSVP